MVNEEKSSMDRLLKSTETMNLAQAIGFYMIFEKVQQEMKHIKTDENLMRRKILKESNLFYALEDETNSIEAVCFLSSLSMFNLIGSRYVGIHAGEESKDVALYYTTNFYKRLK